MMKDDKHQPLPVGGSINCRQVRHRLFKSYWSSWQTLFDEAAAFASEIGEGRLISVSHSCDQNHGVVAVWNWE